MRFAGLALAAVLALAGGQLTVGPAKAQTVSYAQAAGLLAQHCGGDIMKHCRGINLGNNAIHNCLAQNVAQLTPACAANHAGIREMTEARAAAQKQVYKACDRDAAQFCPGLVPGDGNIVSCLLEASKVVSATCTASLVNAGYGQ
ncbi:cysteine rich repeat-containing protein [Xanthobacter oligotrophicus]|uniref:cysteine rich repeat-containing protein n=1 Tax=Xanthobacter oligotrophicus TaxID=2607286 RepID=UPI0011F38F96|nr:cysteine rich repeat-containing protein [Xanthobacter oligotrophicus]MCG5234990.1 cysteine rich repeat-containing protein [Xanthobacter oligotrophicus]